MDVRCQRPAHRRIPAPRLALQFSSHSLLTTILVYDASQGVELAKLCKNAFVDECPAILIDVEVPRQPQLLGIARTGSGQRSGLGRNEPRRAAIRSAVLPRRGRTVISKGLLADFAGLSHRGFRSGPSIRRLSIARFRCFVRLSVVLLIPLDNPSKKNRGIHSECPGLFHDVRCWNYGYARR